MTKQTGLYLMAAGAGVIAVDAITGKGDKSKALFTGTSGILTPINNALPISVSMLLILGGAVVYFMHR